MYVSPVQICLDLLSVYRFRYLFFRFTSAGEVFLLYLYCISLVYNIFEKNIVSLKSNVGEEYFQYGVLPCLNHT
jgi:hypothetical protein